MESVPEKKPWLNAPLDNHRWLAASMHESGYNYEPAHKIAGIVLVQDCNMSGTYYRMIYWKDQDEKSYFTVAGWHSKREVEKMDIGEVVTNEKTKLLYKVVQKPNPYIVILERA